MKAVGTVCTLGFALLASPAGAADSIDAKALHDADCMSCHGTEVYTRDDRRIQSYGGLLQQIDRCVMATRVDWDEAQKTAVVDYLNETFYHFEE